MCCNISVYTTTGIYFNIQLESDVSCGGVWAAARNTARKKGSLDYTGLEVATCRHQFGQKAVNMNRGELYAYALYSIKKHVIPNRVEFVFADVMCKLWKFLKRVDPNSCSYIKGVLSIMHAKGHKLERQVQCSLSFLIAETLQEDE